MGKMEIFFNGLTVEFFKNLFELLFENLRPYKVHGMLSWEYKTLIIRNTFLKKNTILKDRNRKPTRMHISSTCNYDYKYKL